FGAIRAVFMRLQIDLTRTTKMDTSNHVGGPRSAHVAHVARRGTWVGPLKGNPSPRHHSRHAARTWYVSGRQRTAHVNQVIPKRDGGVVKLCFKKTGNRSLASRKFRVKK